MIKQEVNQLTTKINKNSFNAYNSSANVIIKENQSLNQQIKFYEKQIEISKENLVNYFKEDNAKIKEILINDLINLNKEVKDINNNYKKEIEKLNINNEYLNQKLLSKIKNIKEENEKIKEDNFLLLNQIKVKDSIIKLLNKEKEKLIEYDFFQEFERTNLDNNSKLSISLMEKELQKNHKILIKKEKKYNNISFYIDSLNKEKEQLIKKKKQFSKIYYEKPKKRKIKSNLNIYYNKIIINQSKSKCKLVKIKEKEKKDNEFLNNIFFGDFEEDSLNENDDIILEYNLTETNENKLNDKYDNYYTLRNYSKINKLIPVPKLNLKQIEFNTWKEIPKIIPKRYYSVNYLKDINEEIKDIKINIKEIIKKNEKLKDIIFNFEAFYFKIINKINIENSLEIDENNSKFKMKNLHYLISEK